MKCTTWKQRLLRGLAALGICLPTVLATAADLNVNLVIDGNFENVDPSDVGPFGSLRLLSWQDSSGDATDNFAYAYSQGYSGSPAPPGSGSFHFTGGFGTAVGESQIRQSFDVAAGASGALIQTGNAFYDLSGFFSSYVAQSDASSIRARFLDSAMAELGTASVGGADFVQSLPITGGQRDWGRDRRLGVVPINTATVEIEVLSAVGSANHDGYVDLVDFRVVDIPVLPALDITVNRDTGAITLRNQTASPVNLSGYSILSAAGSLNSSNWLSIANNYDANSGGSVDPTNIWTVLSPPSSPFDWSEADLSSGDGTTLPFGASVTLSSANGWRKSPFEDLNFQYVSNFNVVSGVISYVGNGGAAFAQGDFNTDGSLTAADWVILRDNQLSNLAGLPRVDAYLRGDLTGDGRNNHADFLTFRDLYDAANGSGAFTEMLNTIPEPSCCWVLLVGLGLWCRRSKRRSWGLQNNKLGNLIEPKEAQRLWVQ